ncbi:glutaminase domain-containing protein [Bacteroides faecium]|uniref:DUF4965 domain-containing protein n=1 Tax=Bacteroides faecium TaxID=2715212 RepID=A0A6H0KS09_9BACE|nr:DUF4965 domain-containing protein [Bacteroides faecium]QIU96200.1 DUF4965 domain-containing protein [Bacteroides faecium]
MEIRTHIRLVVAWRIIIISGIISLIYACSYSDKKISHLSGIAPSEHTLLAITPDVSIKVIGDSLNKSYPQLRTGKVFPITGLLRVDGKAYRFMGDDSLRISPLAPLSEDTIGWTGKYSFLYPGKGWELREYDDSLWNEGNGAFGPTKGYYYPAHTLWGAENIYVRRHVKVDNKEVLKNHKVYARYVCDDRIKLFCNGGFLLENGFTHLTKCQRLTDEAVSQIVDGDNILAAYCRNTGGAGLLDFGLYIENKTYADAEPATLKEMEVQATQTQFIFQCGDVELQIDFVSPSLSERWDMTGWPVGFLTYQVRTASGKEHTVEVLFDVDTEWMFGKRKIDSWVDKDWRFVKSDSLYLAMAADETSFSCEDNHIVLSQKLCAGNENRGGLLLGYEEGTTFQYSGESLRPLWNKDGTREIKELMMSVGNRYQDLKAECNKLDYRWNIKAFQAGNKAFAEQMLPAYRNFISSHRFVLSSDNKLFCFGDTLSNVREAYGNFPMLLFFNRTDWMKGLLNPIFAYCEDIYWVKKYPPYDIGLYPIASKQVKLEDCAVEAAANMLMMTTAIVEAEQDFGYADMHWKQLCLWADYLQERMKKMTFPSVGLLDNDDERVKCVLGLMAYHKLVQLKGNL